MRSLPGYFCLSVGIAYSCASVLRLVRGWEFAVYLHNGGRTLEVSLIRLGMSVDNAAGGGFQGKCQNLSLYYGLLLTDYWKVDLPKSFHKASSIENK